MINIIRRIKDFIDIHLFISIVICVLLFDIMFFSIIALGGGLKDCFEYPEEDFVRIEETTKEIIDSSKNIKSIDYNEFEKRNYEVEVNYDSNSDYYKLGIKNSKVAIEVKYSLVDNTYEIKRNDLSYNPVFVILVLFVAFPLVLIFIIFLILY